jgi:hypothetical protein
VVVQGLAKSQASVQFRHLAPVFSLPIWGSGSLSDFHSEDAGSIPAIGTGGVVYRDDGWSAPSKRGFDYPRLHQFRSHGPVERTSACHAENAGSIPAGSAKFKVMVGSEWSNATGTLGDSWRDGQGLGVTLIFNGVHSEVVYTLGCGPGDVGS